MTELRKSLRLLFGREFERAEALTAPLRRLFARLRPARPGAGRFLGTGRFPVGRSLGGGQKLRQREGMRRPSKRRSLGALARGGGFTLLSLALHAAMIALLYFVLPEIPYALAPGGETTVTIYLGVPLKRPTPEKPPETQSAPDLTPQIPPKPAPGPDSADTAEGLSGGALGATVVPREVLVPQPPLPIGLGSRSPAGPGPGRGPGTGLGSRGEGKGAALQRYGGGRETEDAVALGLRWLADHQDEDGGWSAEGYQRHCRGQVPCPGRGIVEFDVGVTSLAALAFLGAGHLPEPGPPAAGAAAARSTAKGDAEARRYGRTVAGALDFLLAHQDRSGVYGLVGDHYMYNHSLATFALSEAYALTQSPRYRQSVEEALAASGISQQMGGGWDYTVQATDRNDLSITGWQIMALRSAAGAGIAVPESVLEKVRMYLSTAVTPSGEGIYANLGQEKGRRGINMVAVGLLSKLYLGASPNEAPVRGAVRRLLRLPPEPDAMTAWDTSFQSYYYWYTATLALFHLGGEEWRAWNVLLVRRLLPLQSRKLHEAGSWPPEMNWIGVSGGRVYATAINVLTLETYYRYEPIHASKRS